MGWALFWVSHEWLNDPLCLNKYRLWLVTSMYMICKERLPWQCKGCGLFNQEFVFGCLATMEDDQILTVLFSSWTGKHALLLQRQKQMRPLVLRFYKTQTWVTAQLRERADEVNRLRILRKMRSHYFDWKIKINPWSTAAAQVPWDGGIP